MPVQGCAQHTLHTGGFRTMSASCCRVRPGSSRRAAADWGVEFDAAVLVPILILHDLDKPLLYRREGAGAVQTDL